MLVEKRPNGVTQRQRQGERDTFAIIAHFSQADAYHQRRSHCPLELVLGSAYLDFAWTTVAQFPSGLSEGEAIHVAFGKVPCMYVSHPLWNQSNGG